MKFFNKKKFFFLMVVLVALICGVVEAPVAPPLNGREFDQITTTHKIKIHLMTWMKTITRGFNYLLLCSGDGDDYPWSVGLLRKR
ncbi:hypothetical protein Anas_13146 [Armadillidium nasatum]|uniref:Uncharacterized protein n=1 Tax=Armadillidium nasatum TaxID=96803 RepID=A0A5N5SPY5_9CRUS|nr:hypothetical protein Anas_13146 [Armadillidium nasatum]